MKMFQFLNQVVYYSLNVLFQANEILWKYYDPQDLHILCCKRVTIC